MPRVKRGTKARARHKKILKLAKGNVGGRRKQYRQARETVERGLVYAYRDRKRAQTRVSRLVDHPHQRRGARARAVLQPADARPEVERHRASTARCWRTSRCAIRPGSAQIAARRQGPVSPLDWFTDVPIVRERGKPWGPSGFMACASLENESRTGTAAPRGAGGRRAMRRRDRLEAARVRYLGRKGELTQVLRGLRDVAPAERPRHGRAAERSRTTSSSSIDARR